MKTNALVINPEDRILILAPHPDDESIGVGGLLALYPDQSTVVVMTDGRYGNDKYDAKELKNIRKQEFVNAMMIAGLKNYDLFQIEDGLLINNKKEFEKIDFDKFTTIFLPNPSDNHSDHTACYQFAVDYIKDNHLKCDIYQYEVHNPLANIDAHLDITDVIEKKYSMVNSHSSQMEIHNYGEQIKMLAKYRGIQNEQNEKLLEVYHKVNLENESKDDLGIEIEVSKYKKFARILSEWLHIETNVSEVGAYLINKGMNNIAIYGYGILGKNLYDCLRNSQCNIKYIVDKNKIADVDIHTYHDVLSLEEVDVIIITTVSGFEEIKKEIKNKSGLKCISIFTLMEEIISG